MQNFLRRHYPDQVQGDKELHFAPISAEDALSAPVFMYIFILILFSDIVNYYNLTIIY